MQRQSPIPLCRAEHRSIYREQPVRGAAGMPHVAGGTGSPFRQPPVNARSAGSKRHRVAFSLDTFFWRRKRKYLVSGYENPH
ncbi:hypothetical protein [Methyloglobulus morosus]|uniref:hypothetical protein n=1 Tax=Methyloglobulus morosus TaxID=1410681 RepID=UPI00137B88AD|nr:hypothetical protein [Methyloglobulus morosus]